MSDYLLDELLWLRAWAAVECVDAMVAGRTDASARRAQQCRVLSSALEFLKGATGDTTTPTASADHAETARATRETCAAEVERLAAQSETLGMHQRAKMLRHVAGQLRGMPVEGEP